MRAAIASLVAAVAGHGLAGAMGRWPATSLADEEWRELCRAVRRQRLEGLLAAAIADGAMRVTEPQRAQAGEMHRAAMTSVLHLEARLLEAAEALDRAGVPWRALKGSAAARLDYPDAALRAFGDIDLLVPGARLHEAVDALEVIGARRRQPGLGRAFEQRFAKSIGLSDQEGWQIDLHRTLTLEPFGLRIAQQDMYAGEERFVVAGRELPALAIEGRLMHAAYHASLGDYPVRLLPLRDVAQVATSPRHDTDRTLRLAERWWGRAVLADAVTRAWRNFGLPDGELATWARSYAPSYRESVALAAFHRPDRRQAHRTVATVRTLPGVAERAAYLRGLLRPDSRYLRSRDLGTLQWLRRAGTVLRARGVA